MSEKVNSVTEINIKDIMNLLPHRYPFLLVDKVLDYKANGEWWLLL